MPLMTKIRENMTTFFSVFAGVFVVYIVLDWGMDITGRRHSSRQTESQEVGKINGEAIGIKDFSDLVRQTADNQKTQTGIEPDENQIRLIRDQVWNQIVEQRLYDEQVKKLGVTVPDKEITDWVFSDNPPDFLKRQFTDSTGTFNRAQFEQIIKDPRNQKIMVQVEQALRKQREREKLQSIILASVQVSDGEVLEHFMDQNIKYEGDYMLFDPNVMVKDSEVTSTDEELRKYYNEHSEEYKVEASRRLKYVLFNAAPSKKDSDDAENEMEDIFTRAKAGADFIDLAKTYSDTPVKDSLWFKHGEISQDKEGSVFEANAGDILKPTKGFDGYHFMKVLEFRPGKDEFIRASHILIRIENNDSISALKEAKNVFAAAKRGEDFAELARKHSKDGSAANSGDLGWFGKGRMVKPFEEAAFKAKTGQIVGPVRTQFGYHIIKVVARDNREVRFVDIHTSIRVSSQTKSDIEERAQEFAYLAKQGDFGKEAAQSKYNVGETPPFQQNASIPGVGMHTALNKFSFNNKLGTVSEVISLPNGFGVYMISEVKEGGMRPFEELKPSLTGLVKREQKMSKTKTLAAEYRPSLKQGDSLAMLTTKHPQLHSVHLGLFTFGGGIQGIGRDEAVIGALTSLPVGEISQPIEGSRGVYLFKLSSKTAFDSAAYSVQKNSLRQQLLSEKRNRFLREWSDQIKKMAEIVDNRDLFYR